MDRHDTLLLACGTKENRKLLCSILEEHYNLLEAANAQQAVLLLRQNLACIAAVVLDASVPALISPEYLESDSAKSLLDQVPVIVITADDSSAALQDAFRRGADDVMPLDYNPDAMLQRIDNITDLYLHKRHLEALVAEQADILRHHNETMVDALSSIIEYRSVESGQHILRIRQFTKILLEQLRVFCPEYGLTDTDVQIISSAAALHDIGKIAIPDAILTKPGKLTPEEMAVMRSHALTGCQILQSLGNLGDAQYLRYAYNICRYHHERWDGGGYPEGLAGDSIPICAQVVSLADVYDALTSKRVYKDAYSFDTAANMILNGECGAFSPKLLECFKHITDKYESLARAYADGLEPESEDFSVELPAPSSEKSDDSMARTWAKYQALVHYIGAFLIELDMDNSLFHLIYNPYPELVNLQNVATFPDLYQLVTEQLVVPAQRKHMEDFLTAGIEKFLQDGLRRANYRFRIRSRSGTEGEDFDFTLLRINPADSNRRTLALLCRRVQQTSPVISANTLPLAPAGISYTCRYDEHFTLLQLGSTAGSLSGFTFEDLQRDYGGQLIRLVPPEDREKIRREYREQFRNGTAATVEHRIYTRSGKILWVMNKSHLAVDVNGREYLCCFLTDITAAHAAVDRLNRQLGQYEIILAQTENVLFQWDIATDRIDFSNTWEKIFGFAPISGNVRENLLSGSFFHPDDIPLIFDRIGGILHGSSYEMVEVRIATAKGRYIWCRIRATAIRNAQGELTQIMGIIINIDAEKQAAQALRDQAERDSLTKLLNKNAARGYAEAYFTQFAANINCALLIIDLDDFKLVNDRYGHLFGDSVLSQASREIKKLFRNQDIVARIGGDEFMVLMRGISDRNLVEARCRQLIHVFRNTFRNKLYQLPLSCSIGIALGPEHGSSYFDLYEHADRALYRAKDMGKHAYVFYDPDDDFRSPTQRITAVSKQIDSDEQPGLADGNIVQYAFHRLYSSQDVSASMNSILAMVGQQMNVSRVYVFENSPDNRFCSNTYEWCNTGIQPEIQNLQNISYETDIPGYEANFNEDGIFYCPDVRELPRQVYDIVAPQGIKSMLHCAIRDKGVFRGYIGFDECVTTRFWTKEQIRVLTYFSEMISVFLLKKQEQDRSAQRASELASILDNQNAWIYIIDPDTCELKYVNARAKQLAPHVKTGMRCHDALMGCNGRCENCPSLNIRQNKTCSTVMESQVLNARFLAEATLIQWEGKESCLLTCRELR